MRIKILMVCLGNICRSPLAESILASKLPSNKYFVDSAGTGNWHIGSAPDKRSVAIAKKNELYIHNQKGRQVSTNDFDEFDYIYAMDKSNYKDLLDLAPNETSKTKVQLILNELFPGENVDVPDPYFGNDNGFEQVYNMLNDACEVIADKLIAVHK